MNVIGIIRESGNVLNPHSDTEIAGRDVLLVLGTSEQIARSRYLFRDPVRYPRAGAGALRPGDEAACGEGDIGSQDAGGVGEGSSRKDG